MNDVHMMCKTIREELDYIEKTEAEILLSSSDTCISKLLEIQKASIENAKHQLRRLNRKVDYEIKKGVRHGRNNTKA